MNNNDLRDTRGYLASRLEELWQAAGAPSLDTVARHAGGGSPVSKLTGKKISAWKTGTNVPRVFAELEGVLRVLIRGARSSGTQNVTSGLYDERQWAKWWREARHPQMEQRASDQLPALGQIIDANLNPFDLEVHRAIGSKGDEFSLTLPPYIKRVEDDYLRRIVDQTNTHSPIGVLIGGSSTGKTRMCWEAIQHLAGWRLWHPINPGRPEALLDALERNLIPPRTVLWLNEIQHYLNTPGSGTGERVAAGLRELLRDGGRVPILALGTIWPEYWDILTRWPAAFQRDDHAQARELLTGRGIVVPDSFEKVVLSDLPSAVRTDERIVQALSRPDKKVSQFLAGAFELVSRYNTAPEPARALMDAAIDARRFSFSGELTESLLKEASSGYLSDYEWNRLQDDWFEAALEYARLSRLGVNGPLTRRRPRTAHSPADAGYQLADYLEEYGRRSRMYAMPPETFWRAIATNESSPGALMDLAYEVNYRGRFRLAASIYLMAANAGDFDGFLFLADHRRSHGDIENAESIYRAAIKRGSSLAYVELAELLQQGGDEEAAKRVIEDLLYDPKADWKDPSFIWESIVQIYKDAGHVQDLRTLLEGAVERGYTSAVPEIRRLDGIGDEPEESETLSELSLAAEKYRESYGLWEAAKQELIEASLADKESFPDLVKSFQQKIAEDERLGIRTDNLVMLGRLLAAHGQIDAARPIFLKAINLMDDEAYYEGKIPAHVEFVKTLRMSGDSAIADRAWKYGLELDGSVSAPWNVFDQTL